MKTRFNFGYAIFMAVLFLPLFLMGCKKQNQDITKLEQFVQTINTNPNRELPNGTILSRCEFQEGDSLFTYMIKVNDKRFDGMTNDSIKNIIKPSLEQKLVNLVKKNAIGIQYVFQLPDREEKVVFTANEL